MGTSDKRKGHITDGGRRERRYRLGVPRTAFFPFAGVFRATVDGLGPLFGSRELDQPELPREVRDRRGKQNGIEHIEHSPQTGYPRRRVFALGVAF